MADTSSETRKDRQPDHTHQDIDHNRQGPELSAEQQQCAEHGESLHGERDCKRNGDPGADAYNDGHDRRICQFSSGKLHYKKSDELIYRIVQGGKALIVTAVSPGNTVLYMVL